MKKTKAPPGPPEEHYYKGKFTSYQLYGNNYKGRKYSTHEYDSLNNYQNFLYNRALFGLQVYSEKDQKQINWSKKKRITRVHRRTQHVLNIWKQEIVNTLSNHLFITFFPNHTFTKLLLEESDKIDPEYINKMSFKSLHLSKRQVIGKLIEEGILPLNFHELKPQTTCK